MISNLRKFVRKIITALFNCNNAIVHIVKMSIIGRRHFISEHDYQNYSLNKHTFSSFLPKKLNFVLNPHWHGYCLGS